MSHLFANVPQTIDDTRGITFASGREMRKACGQMCPWCLVSPDVNCKLDCPLRNASADTVTRVIDARDTVEQYDGDTVQARRCVIAAIAEDARSRELLSRAIANELLDTGIYESVVEAYTFALLRVLRAAGALPPGKPETAAADLTMLLL